MARESRAASPFIRVTPPGPKARRMVERDRKVVSHSYTRSYPLVVDYARGMTVTDVDGNRYLDFTSGLGTNPLGHANPKILCAINTQARRLVHVSGTDFYYEPQILLAERLAELAPGGAPKRTFFSNSGAEAIEAALKLARFHTRRPYFLSFYGGFHGRTLGALSVSASKVKHRRSFAPLLPQVAHTPYADCYRCPLNLKYPQCDVACVTMIRDTLFRHVVPPEEVAGIVVEPIQGEGGYIVPPPKFHSRVIQLAHEFGMLYIADEVQTGFGRTGRLFGLEHFDVAPDILVLSKGMGGGMPIGATVAPSSIMTWDAGAHANTFGGHPISCATSLVTLEELRKGLMKSVEEVGEYALARLREMKERRGLIGDVRGKGLMIGVELVKDRVTKERAVAERDAVIQGCFEKGLLLLGAGTNVIRLLPPLVARRAHVDRALGILEETIAEVEKKGA